MLKAEVPANDPTLAACLAKLRSRFTSGVYKPERHGGSDIYEGRGGRPGAGRTPDAESRRPEMNAVAQYLLGHQNANGSWDYTDRQQGDTSISQYAVLGLWEAENGGARSRPRSGSAPRPGSCPPQGGRRELELPPRRRRPGPRPWLDDRRGGRQPADLPAPARAATASNRRRTSPLLTPLVRRRRARGLSAVDHSNAQLDQAIQTRAGAGSRRISPPTAARSPANRLITRSTGSSGSAALADRQTIGRVDWFAKGRDFIRDSQKADGSWDGHHGTEMNTVWAILFLTKSTAKTIRRITASRRLGAGTLLGGRGLPKDLTSMTVAGGRVVSRPMNGAIEGMLAVLEDPRAEQADAARGRAWSSATIGEGPERAPAVQGPVPQDARPTATRACAGSPPGRWPRTGDLDVVPHLIGALTDPDEDGRRRRAAGTPTAQPQDRRPRAAVAVDPRAAARGRRAAGATGTRSIRPLDVEGPGRRGRPTRRHAGIPTSPPSEPPRLTPRSRRRPSCLRPGQGPRRVEVRPVTSLLMAVVVGAIAGRRLALAGLRDEPGIRLAGDRAAPDHRGLRRRRREPRGDARARPRRSTCRGPTPPRRRRTTRRTRATSRSRRSQQTPAAMLDAVSEAGQSLAEVDIGADMPSGGPVASGTAGLEARHRRAGARASGRATAASARTALEHRLQPRPDDRGVCPPARRPGGRAGRRLGSRPAHLYLAVLRAPRRPSGTARGRGTTGSISSGRARAERCRTWPCSRRRGSRWAKGSCSSSTPRPWSSSSPNWRSVTGAGSPPRSVSPVSAWSPRLAATGSRSWPRSRCVEA